MKIYYVRRAKVINIDDSQYDGNKLSRIQLQILPEMKDITDDSLFCWADPMFHESGISNDTTSHNLPEKDSFVTAFILDPYFQTVRYGKGIYIEGFAAYEKWEQIQNNQIIQSDDIDSQTYPQPMKFEIFKDGSFYYRNTESGETGLIHNSGTYTVFDKNGNIKNYGKDKSIKNYNNKGNIELKDSGQILLELKDKTTISINDDGKIEIDTTKNNKDVLVKCNNAEINANTNIYLGSQTDAKNGLIFESGTSPLTLTQFCNAVITHGHKVPQSPTGVQDASPSTDLVMYVGQPSTWKSNTVKTKT